MSPSSAMSITIEESGQRLRDRLREPLEQIAQLQCGEHDEPVKAVIIHGRENGWFDSRWTTCCEALERQAAAILKERC